MNKIDKISSDGRSIRNFIKKLLKERDMTYLDLAQRLNVSEITVKRWMTSHDMKFEHLLKVCTLLGINPLLLLENQLGNSQRQKTYAPEHEDFFAAHPVAFLIFIKILMGYSVRELEGSSKLTYREILKNLNLMESQGILELGPSDKIRLLIRGPFRWSKKGALNKRYFEAMRQSLHLHFKKFSHTVDGESEVVSGLFRPFEFYLDSENANRMAAELAQVVIKYRALSHSSKRSKKAKPIAGLVAIDEFDLWSDVLVGRLSTYQED